MTNKNTKHFFIYFIILIIVSFLFIFATTVLGNKVRVGYLSNFSNTVENKYTFSLRYNSNIFKNNKVYIPIPNTNIMPENVKSIYWSANTYGTLISDKKLDNKDSIENIEYTLKVRKSVYYFFIYIILLFPFFYFFIIDNIKLNYKHYTLLFFIDLFLYFIIIYFIMPLSSMIKINYSIYDIIYFYLFTLLAFNLFEYIPHFINIKNYKIILSILFSIFISFSFFVIETISLTVLNILLLPIDIFHLYSSLITVLSPLLRVITIFVTFIYLSLFILFILLFLFNIYKRLKFEKYVLFFKSIVIFVLFFILFFRKEDVDSWSVDFLRVVNKSGIINTINYRINYDRVNNITPSREEVYNSIEVLKEYQKNRNIDNLLLETTKKYLNTHATTKGLQRDIFVIFLESFYDYSHFLSLFSEDPFNKEYRNWANNSSHISPNYNNGSFYARLSGLSGASPLYPKTQSSKIENVLSDLLNKKGYYTLALEEALNTYNLKTFYPSVGFDETVFGLGITNIKEYIRTNLIIYQNDKPLFVYGFTVMGHTDSHLDNDLNLAQKNKDFLNYFNDNDKLHFIETLDNSVMTADEIIKIRDIILSKYTNALIIFKHDHLYPYLKSIIKRSTIDDSIKEKFLTDYSPSPILVWDGTNGSFKLPSNFVAENIPFFISVNTDIDYTNSISSLLYKDVVDDIISTYHSFYYTKDGLEVDGSIISNLNAFKVEESRKILSQDIFQGKKYYYDIIK